MRLSELWRVTTFRLTMLYGALFAAGMIALLGMIYLQSAVYLTHRLDSILTTEADALTRAPHGEIGQQINEALSLDGAQINVFALFSSGGQRLAGNLRVLPPALSTGGRPIEIPPTADFPAYARLIERQLPGGERLVVGRDVGQLREMRLIIASALIWSGAVTIVIVVGFAMLLSIGPIQRLRVLAATSEEIAAGDLKRRMPTSQRRDELDTFASAVNAMMDEIERLLLEVRGVTRIIAHDLRTPLTRARAQLHRIQQAEQTNSGDLSRVIEDIDLVLERFRALLRISELEARDRLALEPTDLAALCQQAVELYRPLAEEGGVRLTVAAGAATLVKADPKLLFEALSNLIDNAIKFCGQGGKVEVRLDRDAPHPRIIVEDNGPGIHESERVAVLRRYYRGERNRFIPGTGLGLSIVSVIVKLHRFDFVLLDAAPGLRAVIECRAAR